MMHHTSKIGIVLAVALLVTGLAAPASAKNGGHPGPPSGADLDVTVEAGNMMWANSVGDQIPFDITVVNTSGGELTGIRVAFDPVDPNGSSVDLISDLTLSKNRSWTTVLTYVVGGSDFVGLSISEQSQVTVGTVAAYIGDHKTPTDSADAIMTAYPVEDCTLEDGVVSFGPNADYLECSFIAPADSTWTMVTTLAKKPRGKSASPGATVRDGVPGNWCQQDDGVIGQDTDGNYTITVWVYFPTADGNGNIVCERGGAGGDTIPVRNADTFYLATWAGNTVTLTQNP